MRTPGRPELVARTSVCVRKLRFTAPRSTRRSKPRCDSQEPAAGQACRTASCDRMSPSRGPVSSSAGPSERRSARSSAAVTMSGRPAAHECRHQTAPDRRPESDITEATPARPTITRRTGCSSTLEHSVWSTSRSHHHTERNIPKDVVPLHLAPDPGLPPRRHGPKAAWHEAVHSSGHDESMNRSHEPDISRCVCRDTRRVLRRDSGSQLRSEDSYHGVRCLSAKSDERIVLRRFASPTPFALRVSHPLSDLIPVHPCGSISRHIHS